MAVAPPNEHKALAIVLSETEGYTDARLTKTEWARFGAAAKELLTLGATPDEVRLRADRYRRTHPDWEYTANALVSHWGKMASEPVRAPPSNRPVTFPEQRLKNMITEGDAFVAMARAEEERNGVRALPNGDGPAGPRLQPGEQPRKAHDLLATVERRDG